MKVSDLLVSSTSIINRSPTDEGKEAISCATSGATVPQQLSCDNCYNPCDACQ